MISSNVVWISIFIYILFLIVVAVRTHRKNRKNSDTNLLSTKVPWTVLVMTYISSLMSVWIFFSGPGAYYRGGLGYWVSELSYMALFPIIAHFTMNKVWIVNKMKDDSLITPADFYYQRFKSKTLRVILAVIFLVTSFPYISSVLIAIGQAASFATNGAIPYGLAVIVLGVAMTLTMCLGGTESAAIADTIQGIVFILLLWLIVGSCIVIGFNGNIAEPFRIIKETTPSFFTYPGPEGWVTYAMRFGYPLSCAIGWTIMLPHVFVRSGYFGDKLSAQRRLSYFTPILQAIVWTGTMLIGLVGIALIQGLPTSDTELLIPFLIENVIFNSNQGLGQILMVAFVIGTCAVGISTSNGFLSVSSAIVCHDLIEETFEIKPSKKVKLWLSRIVMFILGLLSIGLALNPPELIFTLIMFAIALVMPLFPILLFALYWKKATTKAAIAASVIGSTFVLLTYFVWNVGDTWYGAIGLVASTITMIIVSLFTTDNSQHVNSFYKTLEDGIQRFYKVTRK